MATESQVRDIMSRIQAPERSSKAVTRNDVATVENWATEVVGREAFTQAKISALEKQVRELRQTVKARGPTKKGQRKHVEEELIEEFSSELKVLRKELEKLEKERKRREGGGCLLM